MDWQKLLAHNRVKRHIPSKDELDALRAIFHRDLKDASITATSDDRRFATAYNAVLQIAKMAICCAGYRVIGQGHHQTTFKALELTIGPSVADFSRYFELCRRKRNTVDYDLADVISETEVEELIEKAREFQKLVEDWISKQHPQFVP